MDVDDLLAGLRFDEELAKALATCDVFLTIIGARWMDLLKVKASSGERDFVCEEIAEALRRKIVVIPVRVGREGQLPPLPRTGELPTQIRDLVHYQKHDVAYEYFGRDSSALIDAITAVRRLVRGQERGRVVPPVMWRWAAVIATIGLVYAGASWLEPLGPYERLRQITEALFLGLGESNKAADRAKTPTTPATTESDRCFNGLGDCPPLRCFNGLGPDCPPTKSVRGKPK